MKSLLEDPLLLGVAPQPKGWNTEKLVGWLDTHPVNGVKDVNYFTRIVANRKALAMQIAQQQDNASNGQEELDRQIPLPLLNPLPGGQRQYQMFVPSAQQN
jgi:molecular chaperone DnaK (HSP70)